MLETHDFRASLRVRGAALKFRLGVSMNPAVATRTGAGILTAAAVLVHWGEEPGNWPDIAFAIAYEIRSTGAEEQAQQRRKRKGVRHTCALFLERTSLSANYYSAQAISVWVHSRVVNILRGRGR